MARVSETPGTGAEPPAPAPSAPSGSPAPRYQRSTGGLVGALLVTVLVILGFVGFRALNRDQPDVKPTADTAARREQSLEDEADPLLAHRVLERVA